MAHAAFLLFAFALGATTSQLLMASTRHKGPLIFVRKVLRYPSKARYTKVVAAKDGVWSSVARLEVLYRATGIVVVPRGSSAWFM